MPSSPGSPTRRAPGRRRIEEILTAAAAVFAEQGYDAATTNAIASRAGISPGSLYQYFSNKEAIARALAEHYAEQLAGLREEGFSLEGATPENLEAVMARIVTSLVAFNVAHPGFKALFSRTDLPPGLRDAVAPIQDALHARVTALVGRTLPHLDHSDAARVALVSIQITRGMMPLIVDAGGDARAALTTELRNVLTSYLRSQFAP